MKLIIIKNFNYESILSYFNIVHCTVNWPKTYLSDNSAFATIVNYHFTVPTYSIFVGL